MGKCYLLLNKVTKMIFLMSKSPIRQEVRRRGHEGATGTSKQGRREGTKSLGGDCGFRLWSTKPPVKKQRGSSLYGASGCSKEKRQGTEEGRESRASATVRRPLIGKRDMSQGQQDRYLMGLSKTDEWPA